MMFRHRWMVIAFSSKISKISTVKWGQTLIKGVKVSFVLEDNQALIQIY
jgi:hypothetical protein